MASKNLKNKSTSVKAKKKKKKLTFTTGVVNIHSTANNTIISVADENGNIIAWSSCGTIGFKGTKKSSPYAAGKAAEDVAEKVKLLGIKSVSINNNGIGQGKDTAIRAIMGKLKVTSIRDITAIPHNGCKPPKKPR